jgi:hypothetical protein
MEAVPGVKALILLFQHASKSYAISLQEFIALSFLSLKRIIKRISFAFRFQNLCTSSAESFSYTENGNRGSLAVVGARLEGNKYMLWYFIREIAG